VCTAIKVTQLRSSVTPLELAWVRKCSLGFTGVQEGQLPPPPHRLAHQALGEMPAAPSGDGAAVWVPGLIHQDTKCGAARRPGAHVAACDSASQRPGLGPAPGCADIVLARVRTASSTDARRISPVAGGTARCGWCVNARHPASPAHKHPRVEARFTPQRCTAR
jgi:hypothetical protein